MTAVAWLSRNFEMIATVWLSKTYVISAVAWLSRNSEISATAWLSKNYVMSVSARLSKNVEVSAVALFSRNYETFFSKFVQTVHMNFHAKSGLCSSRNEPVMLNFAIWWPFCFLLAFLFFKKIPNLFRLSIGNSRRNMDSVAQ